MVDILNRSWYTRGHRFKLINLFKFDFILSSQDKDTLHFLLRIFFPFLKRTSHLGRCIGLN